MPRELVEELDGTEEPHAALRAAGAADAMWAVAGGNPACYYQLRSAWAARRRGDITPVASSWIALALAEASSTHGRAVVANPRLAQLYDMFATEDVVPVTVLEDLALVRPSPDKVPRKVWRDNSGSFMLVPVSPAMAAVLRYGKKAPSPFPGGIHAFTALLARPPLASPNGSCERGVSLRAACVRPAPPPYFPHQPLSAKGLGRPRDPKFVVQHCN